MINILVHLTIKAGREDEYRKMAARIAKASNEEDEGCITYHYLQDLSDPREFVVYEQWRDQASLDAHTDHLQAMYGPPSPGERLPAAIGDFFEKKINRRYDAIEW